MAIILLCVLIAVAAAMLVWGLRSPSRMLQFPPLAAAAWLFFIVPQIIGLIRNPAGVPTQALDDHGIELAVFMSVLMAAFGFLGYTRRSTLAVERRSPDYHVGRLFWGGALLIAISLIGFHKLVMLSGGYAGHYSVQGSYALTWRGLPVAYNFFASLVFPGLTLCILACLKQPSFVRWIVVAVGTVVPLANILLLGRRGSLVMLAAVISSSLFFARRWAPPRPLAVAALVIGGALIVLAPKVRTYTQLGADHQRLADIRYTDELRSTASGEHYSEFVYPVVLLPAAQAQNTYGFGRTFYNILISQWVPRLLVGDDFKENLYLSIPTHPDVTQSYCGWVPPFGSNPTGIAQLFFEFWYFGSAIFYVLGRLFRRLWEQASTGNTAAQVYYAWALPYAMGTISGGVLGLPGEALYFSIFVLPILHFARVQSPPLRWPRQGVLRQTPDRLNSTMECPRP